MKKLFALLLALMMVLSLTACGGGGDTPAGTTNSDNGEDSGDKIDAQDIVEEALEEAEEFESFSVDAVKHFLSNAAELELSSLEPEWEWNLKNDYCAYGDDPASGYGHAVIKFTKADGELTEDEYNAWLKKVFNATAAVSQDGYNVIGYEFVGDGEDALAETTLEDAVSGFLSGWAFRLGDKLMVVYVSREYDNDKESTLGSLLYYDSVQVDVGFGLQKDMSDYFDDMEEYEDEIIEALDDYLN